MYGFWPFMHRAVIVDECVAHLDDTASLQAWRGESSVRKRRYMAGLDVEHLVTLMHLQFGEIDEVRTGVVDLQHPASPIAQNTPAQHLMRLCDIA